MGRPKYRTKLTVEVDSDTYYNLTKTMHHGQLSHICRSFITCLTEYREEFFAWLYGNEPLNLPARSKSDATNGQDTP